MSIEKQWKPREIVPADLGVSGTVDGLVSYLDSTGVDDLLAAHQALLFRGFAVSESGLEQILPRILPDRLPYVSGNTPRTKVGENIYTSTEYPPEYVISMHNELSYAANWPSRLVFFCVQPAATGGATPVVDGALWLEALDPEVRKAFSGGVCYQQYLHGGMGLGKSWQATFETEDAAEVEKVLASAQATWEWSGSGGLRVRQVRPATIVHPVSGKEVWFNQVDQWHPAALGEETMRELMTIVPADEMPQSVTFADGSPIPDEYALEVRDKGLETAVDVAWQAGDVLLVDNIAVAHGRRSFSGPRRILVAMSG